MRSVLLCTIMFVSGAAALLFETLWFRQAGLAFGNSVWASSLVLASFMAGLAVGNAAVAHFGARIRRPVRFYSGLELAIGATGLALVHLLPVLGAWLVPLWRPLLGQPWLLNSLRLLVGFALMLVPATAMGATLPVLVKALRRHDPSFGSVLGRLYGWNTLGAVVGAVIGEMALIEALGIRGSAAAAAGLNAAAAAAAFVLAPRIDGRAPAPVADPGPPPRLAGPVGALLGAACLSGAILLSLEVVWFRFLHLFVYDTSRSFALVLAVVLAGIGIGGAAAGAWLRRDPEADRHGPLLALLAGLCSALAYRGFDAALAPFGSQILRAPVEILWLSATLMLPVSLLSGALFTVTGAALARRVAPETRAAGWLTLANTVGAAAGALLAGFALLPRAGVEGSIFALAASYAGVALLLWRGVASGGARARLRLAGAGAAAFAVALLLFPFGRMEAVFLPHVARRFDDGNAVVAGRREGLMETVLVLRKELYGQPVLHRLVTGGFGMASTSVWARRYMKQFVYWPVALHRQPTSALLISYGIGNTAKALTDTAALRHIDIVDISRDVLEMSDLVFSDPAEHPLRDPRVSVHVDDGRFFLATTERRYDLITSEPPPPKHAGVVNLYTREYFQLIRDRLAEGGINTYWLPVHALLLSDTKSIIRSYCEVFDDCSLWTGAGYNWMLVGSRGASWDVDEAEFQRQWSDPVVAPELRALGFERAEQLGATFIADARELRAATRDAPPLVDDFPKRLSDRVEFGRMAGEHRSWMNAGAARERFRDSAFIRRAWPEGLRQRTLGYFETQRVIDWSRGFQRPGPLGPAERLRLLHAAATDVGLRELVLWLLGIDADQLGAMDRHLAAGGPATAHAFRLGARALADGDFDAAARWFEATRSEPFGGRFLVQLRLYALCRAGRMAEAEALAREQFAGVALEPDERAGLLWLGETFGLPIDAG